MKLNPVKTFVFLLMVVHAVLVLWAIAGFIEWFSVEVPWSPISNEHFPREILFLQWGLTLGGGITFIWGYISCWKFTPYAMACIYAAMATLCAIQTFGFMKSDLKYVAMLSEYVAYAGILLFLFRSEHFRTIRIG